VALPQEELRRRQLIAEIDAELEQLEQAKREAERRRWRHAWTCMMLAVDLDTWFALCRGDAAPAHRIDQDWKAVLDARPDQ